MKRLISTLAAVMMATSLPAGADEVEDTIAAALDAYRSGDIKTAKEEIDFVQQLLGQMKAAGLQGFLPEPFSGWDREEADSGNQGFAALGGGQFASAVYRNGSETVEIQIMADNQMVTAMAAMFSNAALMGAMGTVKRINRQKVVITNDGEVQTLINNRIMVQVTGSADVADKEAYFAAIDMRGLKDF